MITMNELFNCSRESDDPTNNAPTQFKWTGIMPRNLKRMAYYGEVEHLSKLLGVRIPKI